jgi:small ligand-binding sensory domain FIST
VPFAAALSEHPVAAHAVGEVVGQVIEEVGVGPDLACLFVTAPHTGAMEDIVPTVHRLLRPGVLVGATAVSVLAGRREAEEHAAIALWAGRLPRPVTGFRMGADLEVDLPHDGTLLLLTDPFSFPTDGFLEWSAHHRPGLGIVGGVASGARGPGGNRLVLHDRIHSDGAVAVHLDTGMALETVVSQGCRPVGAPFTVTRGEGQLIHELAGRPALERLEGVVAGMTPEERRMATRGLHIGRVINEQRLDFGPGDFLIRNVLGADRSAGAVAIGGTVEVGETVQFQVRDAESADEDLRVLLAEAAPADGALVFTCNGRGTHLFRVPDHDASVISDHVEGGRLAGMFCAGELGPIGGRNFLHGFTASVVLFRD